jgi:membrane associated rhomboid family serine protease
MSLSRTVPLARLGNPVHVGTSNRAAVWLGSTLSVVAGAWAVLSMASPFGVVAGTAAALFGLAFGALALLANAAHRWRKTALVGIATSSLALLVAAAELVSAVLVE